MKPHGGNRTYQRGDGDGRPLRRECEYRATAQTPSSRELRREGSDSSPRPVARQPRRTPYFDSGTQSNPCPVREPLRGCCRVETAVGRVQARGFDRHRRGRCIRDIQVAVRSSEGIDDAPTPKRHREEDNQGCRHVQPHGSSTRPRCLQKRRTETTATHLLRAVHDGAGVGVP